MCVWGGVGRGETDVGGGGVAETDRRRSREKERERRIQYSAENIFSQSGSFSMGNEDEFSRGKMAATESRYPTHHLMGTPN